jgi:tetratricopeptide (TPR) repeat protein
MLAERMIALQPEKPEWRLEQQYADSNLGIVLLDLRRFAEAAAVFQSATAAVEGLAAGAPNNADYQKMMLEALAWLSSARAAEGRLDDALAQRERQIALIEKLIAATPGDVEYPRKAMSAHRAMSRLLLARGDVPGALDQARRATEFADAVMRTEPGNTEWLEAAAAARLELAALLRNAGDAAQAAPAVRAGCDMTGRLIARDRTVRAWSEDLRLACLHERARLALIQRAPEEAVALSRQAVAIAKTSSDTPTDAALARASAYELAGDALAAAGRPAEARSAWAAGVAAWPSRVALSPWDLAQQAALLRKVGNLGRARQIETRLDEIGFRQPEYLRNRSVRPA